MKFYTNDHVELVYDDQGEPSDPPVVILSGIGAYKEYWEATIKTLVAHHYRVINVDARNQGQSEHTSKGLRISRHAADLFELIAQLQLTQPVLMGNSMGASTMLAYLSLYGAKNVRAVVDVDQSPKMINDATWKWGFKDLTWEDFHEVLKRPLGKSTYTNFDETLFTKLQSLKKQAPYDAELNYPLLIDHATQDWRDIITHLECPLLIVSGQESPFFAPEMGAVVAGMSEHVTAVVISQAGHLVMAEQPRRFNAELVKFLTSLPA
ncbi:alpha/beta hydrolase [Fructilactobacillus myrtifloralis]|uniref:Alpha/beta hydrolase n=1 Tax=Fructilactobacillus myrtifloralis TaxID=2940301 RepID=A0ABY5BLS8_9LACO|nr:alpha/beta hydrolase [Fructilactobacillus myrtifloralis]USS84629.1 alpha/beta hydrolase [Fructilactobacillus myrtifloralis]